MNTGYTPITRAQIAEHFGVSLRTVTERWSKQPDFPKPRQVVSQKTVIYAEEDIKQWKTT